MNWNTPLKATFAITCVVASQAHAAVSQAEIEATACQIANLMKGAMALFSNLSEVPYLCKTSLPAIAKEFSEKCAEFKSIQQKIATMVAPLSKTSPEYQLLSFAQELGKDFDQRLEKLGAIFKEYKKYTVITCMPALQAQRKTMLNTSFLTKLLTQIDNAIKLMKTLNISDNIINDLILARAEVARKLEEVKKNPDLKLSAKESAAIFKAWSDLFKRG